MTADEAGYYDRALRRIYLLVLCLGCAGSLGTAGLIGWQWGLGFLFGAAISALNFRWLHQFVSALGPDAPRPKKRLLIFLCLRYLLLGLGGYVILMGLGLGVKAALAGLLVPVAAVITEILFELTHGA